MAAAVAVPRSNSPSASDKSKCDTGVGVKSGWKGEIDHVALWDRALTDADVERLAGGAAAVAPRKVRYLGVSD